MSTSSIQVTPFRLEPGEIEMHVPQASPVLPNQLLRFDVPDSPPVYGKVLAVRVSTDRQGVPTGFQIAKVRILSGEANFDIRSALVLDDEALWQAVQQRYEQQGGLENPFSLPSADGPGLTLEITNLETLTVIEGKEFAGKYEALVKLLNAVGEYVRLLVIDPLGLFAGEPGVNVVQAGQTLKLSIQRLGVNRFMGEIAGLLPESARQDALRALMQQVPTHPDFVPFSHFLKLERPDESAVKKALLATLYEVHHQHVFAETEAEVFSRQVLQRSALTVLDLSSLQEPWKALFYEAVLTDLLRNAGNEVLPVLIYPENYLPGLPAWIPKAEEAEMSLLAFSSPYADGSLAALADNRLTVDESGHLVVSGSLTHHLPARLRLAGDASLGAHLLLAPSPPDQATSFAEPGHAVETAHRMGDESWTGAALPEISFPAFEEEDEPFDFNAPAAPAPETPLAGIRTELPQSPEPPIPIEEEPAPTFDSILGRDADTLLENEAFSFSLEEDEAAPVFAAQDLEPPSAPPPVKNEESNPTLFPEIKPVADEPAALPPYGAEPEVPLQEDVPMYQTRQLYDQEISQQAGFQVGDRVRHEKYGLGIINKMIPMDEQVILNVTFEKVGKRLVDPRLSRLEKA